MTEASREQAALDDAFRDRVTSAMLQLIAALKVYQRADADRIALNTGAAWSYAKLARDEVACAKNRLLTIAEEAAGVERMP